MLVDEGADGVYALFQHCNDKKVFYMSGSCLCNLWSVIYDLNLGITIFIAVIKKSKT